MTTRLQLILLGIVASVAMIDMSWLGAGHFDVDGPAYGGVALLAAACAAGGVFYERVRKDDRLAAMLVGTSFLLGLSASFSVLNYLLITVAGPRIDLPLAAIDRAMGFDWPSVMAWAARHPVLDAGLQLAYISVLPQITLLVAILGWQGKQERIYAVCLALAAGALVCIALWTIAPSFGAFSVFDLPTNVSSHLAVALDGRYARALVALLEHGPGHISPRDAKGLIGFPSFHAVLALFVVWYAREVAFLRWPALILNAVVLVATPIQGGHHLIDVLAGVPVAAVAILFAARIVRLAARANPAFAVEIEPAGI